jgi:hypothetical protein
MALTGPIGATTAVTATAAAGTGVTLTLAAPAATCFHYITHIEIHKFAAALLVAAATPVLVTTTNLVGNPVFDFSAGAELAGSGVRTQVAPGIPIKSSVAATATTIVCPATTSIIWRVTAFYYIAP